MSAERGRTSFAALVAAALLGGLVAVYAQQWLDRPRVVSGPEEPAPRPVEARGDLAADEKATIELFERAKGSVVYISTSARVIDLFTRNIAEIPRGTGSGFIWDTQGHVVTNNHVAQSAPRARVRLNDGRDYPAKLVGASPAHDLAVLRIEVLERRPAPLPIGTSANLRVGQKAFAIGNPFGLDWSLTTGIVSALNRALPTEEGGQIDHLIQTDAAINPGNSGGPLLDSAGRLIGINTAIFSPSGAYAGVGFAVPVDTVNRVVPQLIAKGTYVRPALGIEAHDEINQHMTQRLGVKGVAVMRAAQGVPLKPGDVIVAVDGQPVESVAQLLSRIDEHKVGETVRLKVYRDGKEQEIATTLRAGT
jgi:S1-C subfamily serine protease